MYNIDIITIFPELFLNFFENSIIKRAQLKGKVSFALHNLRDFTIDKNKTVDDTPYGGGAGMVLKPEPFFRAVTSIKKKYKDSETKVIMLTPKGELFSQNLAKDLSKKVKNLIFLCGRYEGFDERIKKIVDYEISIGEYVLNGGELPAMVVSEAVIRLIPGVIGKEESFKTDSFYNDDSKGHPQYTKPRIYKGLKVPDVLLSGNHKKIEQWRKKKKN